MLVDALTGTDLPMEVRARRALRSSAAQRARLARRRRGRRQTLALVATAACALIAVPAASDASTSVSSMSTVRQSDRCALPGGLRDDFVAAARATGLPLGLLAGVARVESRFSVRALSPAGAIGVMQLMPSTADSLAP
jgi:soluble lytic murein transglycosylase-like protein